MVAENSNEIPAAQNLTEALNLEGRLYTLDAMHCKKTFRAARPDLDPEGKLSSACSA